MEYLVNVQYKKGSITLKLSYKNVSFINTMLNNNNVQSSKNTLYF